MKRFSLPLLLLIVCSLTGMTSPVPSIDGRTTATPLQEADEGNISRELDLRNFSGLEVHSAIALHYTQGNKYSVRVETTQELYDKLVFTVEDGKLVCRHKEKVNDSKDVVDLYVTAPKLEEVAVFGVLQFEASAPVKQETMEWEVNGVLKMKKSTAQVSDFSMEVNGVCSIENLSLTNGKKLAIEGNGVLNGNVRFSGEECSVSMNGMGTLDLNVDCNTLDVSCQSAVSLNLSGKTKKLNTKNGALSKINVKHLKH